VIAHAVLPFVSVLSLVQASPVAGDPSYARFGFRAAEISRVIRTTVSRGSGLQTEEGCLLRGTYQHGGEAHLHRYLA
jgi:hypothetical protein